MTQFGYKEIYRSPSSANFSTLLTLQVFCEWSKDLITDEDAHTPVTSSSSSSSSIMHHGNITTGKRLQSWQVRVFLLLSLSCYQAAMMIFGWMCLLPSSGISVFLLFRSGTSKLIRIHDSRWARRWRWERNGWGTLLGCVWKNNLDVPETDTQDNFKHLEILPKTGNKSDLTFFLSHYFTRSIWFKPKWSSFFLWFGFSLLTAVWMMFLLHLPVLQYYALFPLCWCISSATGAPALPWVCSSCHGDKLQPHRPKYRNMRIILWQDVAFHIVLPVDIRFFCVCVVSRMWSWLYSGGQGKWRDDFINELRVELCSPVVLAELICLMQTCSLCKLSKTVSCRSGCKLKSRTLSHICPWVWTQNGILVVLWMYSVHVSVVV